jgi:hypothetical protein
MKATPVNLAKLRVRDRAARPEGRATPPTEPDGRD